MRLLRIVIAAVALFVATAGADAANVVSVSPAKGDVGTRVEVKVALETDGEAVAAEIHVPLPDEVEPVPDALAKADSRLPEHSVTANVRGKEYVIVIYSLGLQPIPAGSGVAVRFTLDLQGNPGRYDLTPTVKFSDCNGNRLSASAGGGLLEVIAPRLALSATDIDFGRVPIRGTYTRTVTATNTGTAPLRFSDFTTDIPGLSVAPAQPTLAAGASTQLTLTYAPTVRAAKISGRFTALSNGVGRAPYVRVTSVPFSVNELHTCSASGVSDEEVTVALTMNNMEPIVGAEVTFRLPEALEYVEGSVEASARAKGLTATASLDKNRNLRIILFGLGNRPVEGEDGELLTFRLLLNGTSGWYYLSPENEILANAGEENMTSATSGAYVSIMAPYISGDATQPLGYLPLGGPDTFEYYVNNYGSAPLRIDRVMFLDDVCECRAEMPLIVPTGGSATIPVTVRKPVFGEFASTMNIYSNDPANRLKTVSVSGNWYSPNELHFSGQLKRGVYKLNADLANEADITALQLDIVTPAGAEADPGSLTLAARAKGHTASAVKVGEGRYRVVIFSLTNEPFSGSEGTLFTLDITGDKEGKRLRIENIKLSGPDGVDYTTPATDLQLSDIPLEEFFLPGDVNDDDTVNTLDLNRMINFLLNPGSQTVDATRGDMNGDSKINTLDINKLINIILNGE